MGPNVYELRTYQLRVSGWAAACIVVRTGLGVLKSDFQNVFYSSKMGHINATETETLKQMIVFSEDFLHQV